MNPRVFFTVLLAGLLWMPWQPAGLAQSDPAALEKELETLRADRDNILKQAKTILKEKEDLMAKLEQIKGSSSGIENELDALRKENEILKSEASKLEMARDRDKRLFEEEMRTLEIDLADAKAKRESMKRIMDIYTPEKIQELIEDRNRLQEENKKLAARTYEAEKKMEMVQKSMVPLELDREELHRVLEENKALHKRLGYVEKLEKRQKELVAENTEYREHIEVLKAKVNETVPNMAKANRISQKMMRENADMHYNLGTIFLHNKMYREAVMEYEQVLELRPNDPETHYNLGILYDDYLSDQAKAQHHYQKYLSINPRAPDAKKVESFLLSLELEQKVR